MKLLYDLFIWLYGALLYCAAPFHKKASLWVNGRKDWATKLQERIIPGQKIIWVHCASLGEFEQGRPLIEAIRSTAGGYKILLTFFSPSGYEIRKDYKGADIVCYLPLDTVSNATKFLDIVKPEKVFFIKYEFWFNYLSEIRARNMDAYLVSAIFRQDQLFFKGYGQFAKNGLKAYKHIFVQDDRSKELLSSIHFTNVTVAGDTRFDRVVAISDQVTAIPVMEQFCAGQPMLIAGSTWPEDEELLSKLDMENYKLVIAPHEISQAHIRSIQHKFEGRSVVLFSRADAESCKSARVLIIDNVGMLSSIYKYATLAYVGGGFGKGIHNILEPAVFGMPVLFGPQHTKFKEAAGLVQSGAGFSISSYDELNSKIRLFLHDPSLLQLVSAAARYYVKGRTGATKRILEDCFPGQKIAR